MNRRNFIRATSAGAGLFALGGAAAVPPAGRKANIVFILTDDLGRAELGC